MFYFLLTNLFLSNRNLNQCVNKSDDLATFNSLKNSVWQVPEEKKIQVLNEKNFCSFPKNFCSAPETKLTIFSLCFLNVTKVGSDMHFFLLYSSKIYIIPLPNSTFCHLFPPTLHPLYFSWSYWKNLAGSTIFSTT